MLWASLAFGSWFQGPGDHGVRSLLEALGLRKEGCHAVGMLGNDAALNFQESDHAVVPTRNYGDCWPSELQHKDPA